MYYMFDELWQLVLSPSMKFANPPSLQRSLFDNETAYKHLHYVKPFYMFQIILSKVTKVTVYCIPWLSPPIRSCHNFKIHQHKRHNFASHSLSKIIPCEQLVFVSSRFYRFVKPFSNWLLIWNERMLTTKYSGTAGWLKHIFNDLGQLLQSSPDQNGAPSPDGHNYRLSMCGTCILFWEIALVILG